MFFNKSKRSYERRSARSVCPRVLTVKYKHSALSKLPQAFRPFQIPSPPSPHTKQKTWLRWNFTA